MPSMTLNGTAVDYLIKLVSQADPSACRSAERAVALEELQRHAPNRMALPSCRASSVRLSDDAYEAIQLCLRDTAHRKLIHQHPDVPTPAAATPFERRAITVLANAFEVQLRPNAEAA